MGLMVSALSGVFPSKLEIMRHADRLAPTTFLKATERRFRSSLLNSLHSLVRCVMNSTISSYLSACSANLAWQTKSESTFSPMTNGDASKVSVKIGREVFKGSRTSFPYDFEIKC